MSITIRSLAKSCFFFVKEILFNHNSLIFKKSFSFSLLFFFNSITAVLSFFRKRVLMMWIFLELNFYSSLPLVKFYKKFPRRKLVFFLVKIFRSFLFLFSLVFKKRFYLIYLALFIKLSVFPMLWVPVLIQNVEWVILPTILVINKFPAFKVFLRFYTFKKIILIGLLFIFSTSRIMLIFKRKKIGLFLGWSSIAQRVILVFLLYDLPRFYFYFIFYRIKTSLTFFFLLKKQGVPVNKVFLGFLFFFKGGFPPLLIFFIKVLFLGLMPKMLMLFFVGNFFVKFMGYFSLFKNLFLKNLSSNMGFIFIPFTWLEKLFLILLGILLVLTILF